jgi:RNA recognition motif-containing protein
VLNKAIFEEYEISCAISKSPTTGYLFIKLRENDTRTIFVNNLPFSVDENKISQAFMSCGDILDIRIIRDKQTNKPKGYGYVEFQDDKSVNIALEMKEMRIDGRKIIIKRSQSDTKMREKLNNVVYLTNIAYDTKEKDLVAFFFTYGVDKIQEIHIVRDEDGASKGFAFVQLEDEV